MKILDYFQGIKMCINSNNTVALYSSSCYNISATKSMKHRGAQLLCPRMGYRCLLFVAENNVPACEGASLIGWVEGDVSEMRKLSLHKLFLNILVLVCIVVPCWIAYEIFVSKSLSLASSGAILAVDIGVLIWNISVLRHYKHQSPSFFLTTFAILFICIVLAFLGVEPLASMKDTAIDAVEQKTQTSELFHSNEIATVEDMGATPLGLSVSLKPIKAEPNTTYIIELYEKGNLRARKTLSWNQVEINVGESQTMFFGITANEIDAYWKASISDTNWWKPIFSVKIIDNYDL